MMSQSLSREPREPELFERGNQLRATGANWSLISRTLGLSLYRTRTLLDPGYADKERAKAREGVRRRHHLRKLPPLDRHLVQHSVSAFEAARAIASVPKDTRSVWARTMGDPLPGRSALEQRVNEPLRRTGAPSVFTLS